MYKNILLSIIFAMSLLSCNKEETTGTPSNGYYAQAPATPQQQKLLDLVNKVRATGTQCGSTFYPPTTPITWNNTLAQAAQKHSDYMDSKNDLNHTGANGSNPGERITAEGYQWSTYGENIAVGYPTEEAVIQGWLESEGHCKNIMNPDFKEMGIATKGAYWTQVFATPL